MISTKQISPEADLSGADLAAATFSVANGVRANFHFSELSYGHFFAVDATGTNFRDAIMRGTNLNGIRLNGSDFSEAALAYTIFADLDLSVAKGLDSVQHDGPSTIGIDTIFRSKGEIPEKFLRGAGVPDAFITYAKSLVGSAIEFYSCFISHSTKDQGFADRLYSDLRAKGVRCWFAPHDVQGGRKLHEQIDEAIRLHQKLLLILSHHSIKSAWVETEIRKARKRERQEDIRVLFPVRLVSLEGAEKLGVLRH